MVNLDKDKLNHKNGIIAVTVGVVIGFILSVFIFIFFAESNKTEPTVLDILKEVEGVIKDKDAAQSRIDSHKNDTVFTDYFFVVDIPDEYDLSLDYYPETRNFGGAEKYANHPDYQYTYDTGLKAGDEMDKRTLETITGCYWYEDLRITDTLECIDKVEKVCKIADEVDGVKLRWRKATKPNKFATINVYYDNEDPYYKPYGVQISASDDTDYVARTFLDDNKYYSERYSSEIDSISGFDSTYESKADNVYIVVHYYDSQETGGEVHGCSDGVDIIVNWATMSGGTKKGALDYLIKMLEVL